jgi:hypothetical protein
LQQDFAVLLVISAKVRNLDAQGGQYIPLYARLALRYAAPYDRMDPTFPCLAPTPQRLTPVRLLSAPRRISSLR